MILLLLIILFIIFLLYRFRQRTVEEYIIDSVDLSWRNKTGVENVVNKWILVVKDKNNNEIHRAENNDSNNRKNDTDVKLNVFSNKTFGDNIIGNNTIDIYYNEVSGDKKVNTQLLRFEKDEFTNDLGSFEFHDLDMSAWENAQNADCEGIYSKVKKNKSTPGVEKFGCGPQNDPNKHWCQFWKHTHTQKQLGTGKACSRGDGHVIKVQWPKKTNTDRVGLQFVDDPDPNTDSKVADSPQHYKSLFDQQQAIVDAQEKENARIAKEEADKAASEALGGVIPNQTKLGEDGWCGHGGVVIHQVDGDVNTAKGCKRICSDIHQIWTRDTSYGKWDSDEANNIVNECTDAKLDIIWEKDGDGKRKLRSGFKASKDYVPPSTSTSGIKYVWFGYENSGWEERPLNIAEIEVYSGGVNIVRDFTDDKVESSSQYPVWWATPIKLFDGSKSNMAHTKDSGTNWWKIDLGKEYSAIDKVMVYNRDNCCWDRWAGSFVKLLNKKGKEIMRSTDTLPSNKDAAKNYKEGGVRVKTFTFGNTVGASSPPMNLPGGFKWYYYQGSYFSVPSSFNNATPTKTGTGIKNFSSKHNATGGYLPNHGNKSNYAVRWQGHFVPKQTGSHKFWTESDDMSYLYVNYKKVIDNGGTHGMVKKSGTYNMTKGKEYLIEIFFSEKSGGDEIKVWFQGPDMSLAKHDFSGYMVNDTKICSSGMFGGRGNNGITDYKHCLECAHKWEPGLHKRSINCENIWIGDD